MALGMVEMPQVGAWAWDIPTPVIPPGSFPVGFPFPPGPPGYPMPPPQGPPTEGLQPQVSRVCLGPEGGWSSWQRER